MKRLKGRLYRDLGFSTPLYELLVLEDGIWNKVYRTFSKPDIIEFCKRRNIKTE